MGQVNSSTGEAAGTENGRAGLIQRATEELSAATSSGELGEDHVKCVKARIDMIIEDCLNLEAHSDSEQERKDENKKKDTDSIEKEGNSDEKKENLIKDYLEGAKSDFNKTETGSIRNNGGIKIEKENKSIDEKADKSDDSQSEEKKPSEQDLKLGGKSEHVKVSDIISEMVSTEINQTNLTQLQKRTITTFNTFIDKVLDTTLQQEMGQEDSKPSDPSIIQLVNESYQTQNEQGSSSAKKMNEKTESNDTGSLTSEKPKTSRVTLKDHIEKLLERTIQEPESEAPEKERKEIKRERFDAQGLLNNIIVQGLKRNDSCGSKSQLKVEPQRSIPEGYSQKHLKPIEKGGPRGSQSGDIHRQKSPVPVPNFKRERESIQEMKSNRSAPKDQGMPNDPRYKDMYMNWRGDLRPDPRDMYNYGAFSGRRNSMSERSREVYPIGSSNKHLTGNVRGPGPESASAFQQFHPAYNPDFYKAYTLSSLGHGHSPDPRAFPSRDNKPPHPRDCMCPLCVQNAHSLRSKPEQPVPEPMRDKRSPNVPPHLAGLPAQYRESAGLIRPSAGFVPYHPSPKLITPHQQMTSPKEPNMLLVPPGEIPSRRQSMSEGSPSPHYLYKRNEDNTQMDRSMNKPGLNVSQSPSGPRYTRTLSSQSGSSDSSDSPLDLSVKKPKLDPSRNRSASFTNSSSQNQKRIANSFIRHLENSVDKHWQEMCSPSSSPSNSSSPKSQLLYPESRQIGQVPSRGHSPGAVSPSGSTAMLHNRHLPSPHYAGGITVGQPLVNLERNSQTTPEGLYPSPGQFDGQSQTQFSQGQVDSNRTGDNISKHEPIQNIIGNHDPNDILYLICRMCTQTYGSPYAFRKHFRSNHGFEPRAEHTLVQTISATKMALHLPALVPDAQAMANHQNMANHRKEVREKSRMSPQTAQQKTNVTNQVAVKPPPSPVDSKSQHGSESGESDTSRQDIDRNETKCLECPECGKSFQLNDFGSYKRHCRQHGNLLTSGSYTCTDCHLHFPDQKALREHYLQHVKESPLDQKENKKNNHSNSGDLKVESHLSGFSCLKCNIQFEKIEMYTKHVASHDFPEDGLSKFDKHGKQMKDMNMAQMDISVNTSSSLSIVKQAAESMTSQVCPDSSWDNVVKGVATSNKPDETSSDMAEGKNSPKLDSMAIKSEERSDNSPVPKGVDLGSDASDANTQDSADISIYKHKKFFHHRKRANMSSHEGGSEPKQTKLSGDSTNFVPVSNSSKVFSMNTDSCDSSGYSDNGSNTSSVADLPTALATGGSDKKDEKSAKTEARHNLPFVWDRPTRSQKKL